MTEDFGKATIDLLQATKAIVERDLGLGFVTPERLRFTIEARKEAAIKLSAEGLSQRQIAEVTGASPATINRDLKDVSNETESVSNETSSEKPEDVGDIKELVTKVATDLYDEQNCKARLVKLQMRAGKGLLELRALVEAGGGDWWEWYEQRNLRPKREAERLMTTAQREMED